MIRDGGERTRLSAAWHSTNDVKVTRQIKRGEGRGALQRLGILFSTLRVGWRITMASPKGYRRSDKLIRLLYSMSRTSLSFCFFHIKHRSGKRKPLLLLVVILLNHVSKTALFFPFLSICHFLFRDAEIPHRRKPKFDNAPAPRCSLRELLFFFFVLDKFANGAKQ